MPQILVIALGPIQDFIAAARRCRDLWFGSWLLSELSKAAALAVANVEGAELVFPSPLADLALGSETSVANKIVLRIPDGISAADVAERGRAAMQERLRAIRDRAFQQIKNPGDLFLRETAEAQVGDLIEYVWASAAEGPGG